ncbi:MAG: D-glycero-beta-D-manno-heptose 1-phosphate adenylyltransferase [Planctomycetota bacterium]|nr:D-glycero-beta-D-manno-heptose 1-phosphate adenylyltransferase [Planctomycetota bacterium]
MSSDLLRVIDEMPRPKILVVGDLILDRYISGTVERVSPEAPIQVLRQRGADHNVGGTAAVASNLARLGAHVSLVGVIGTDGPGKELKSLLEEKGLDLSGVVAESGRPTTLKTRFVAASQHARQQILRVDHETDGPLRAKTLGKLDDAVAKALSDVDVCVLSDYAKGVLRTDFCARLIGAARDAGVPVLVDPKGGDFSKYRAATAITPNRTEAAYASGTTIESYEDAAAAAGTLVKELELDCIYITLDRDGIFVRERGTPGAAVRTDPREVYDVTGAGDNVMSVLAYALGGGTSPLTAAALANIAGGIAVEHFGVVTVGWDEIAARVAAGGEGEAKLVRLSILQHLLESARSAGRKVVFTNGCFDLIHPGHVDLLRRARALGDLLVVGMNDDASIKRLKGPDRPVNELGARASVLGGLASVDYITSFSEDTPEELIRAIKPDVLVKGDDWAEKGVVGSEFVESRGGKVVLLPLVEGHSTTSILRKLEDD